MSCFGVEFIYKSLIINNKILYLHRYKRRGRGRKLPILFLGGENAIKNQVIIT